MIGIRDLVRFRATRNRFWHGSPMLSKWYYLIAFWDFWSDQVPPLRTRNRHHMLPGDRNPRSNSLQVDLESVLARFTDAFEMLLFHSILGFLVRSGPSTQNQKSWPRRIFRIHLRLPVAECEACLAAWAIMASDPLVGRANGRLPDEQRGHSCVSSPLRMASGGLLGGQRPNCKARRGRVLASESEFHLRSISFSLPETHHENSKTNWIPPGQAVSRSFFDF